MIRLVPAATTAHAGSVPAHLVAALLETLPLAWRSRYPLAVAVVVMSSVAAEDALVGYEQSVAYLAVLVIVAYSLGAYSASVPRMLVGLAVVAVAVGLIQVKESKTHSASTLAVNLLESGR